MTFAQALTDAKTLIQQLSNRIKADGEKIKSLEASFAADLAKFEERKKQFEQLSLERQLVVEEKVREINELHRKLSEVALKLPTDADAAALAEMIQLLDKAGRVMRPKDVTGQNTTMVPEAVG